MLMHINDMYSHTKHEFYGLDSFGATGKCSFLTLSFGQKDRQMDTGKTICHQSFDAGA